MDKNPFLKRLMKDKKEDVIHTSAFSEAQNAGKIGSASTTSFADRRDVDKNRQVVRGYGDSKIVNEAKSNKPKAQTYDASRDKILNSGDGGRESKALIGDRLNNDRWGNNNRMVASNSRFQPKNGVTQAGRFSTQKPAQPPARKNPGIFR